MKTEKAIVAVGGILIGAMVMAAPAFVNDICLPSSLYLLSDVQNDLFVQPFIKRWRPYDDYVSRQARPRSPSRSARATRSFASRPAIRTPIRTIRR